MTAMATSESRSQSLGVYENLLPNEIRVVEIKPGKFDDLIKIVLKVVKLDDEPVYDALSYVWHPKDYTIDTLKELKLCGVATVLTYKNLPMPLGANLEAAIRHLRPEVSDPSASRILWIDVICINQRDTIESNHQVGLMKDIYSSARQVLIWLGPADKKTDFGVEVLQSGHIQLEENMRFTIALDDLIWRDWFKRVWVVQDSRSLRSYRIRRE